VRDKQTVWSRANDRPACGTNKTKSARNALGNGS
jgi:hypothetical protein